MRVGHTFSVLLILLSVVVSFDVGAAQARMSTYLEGRLIKKTRRQWVLQAPEGRYWISVARTPSWQRKLSQKRVSFWVQVHQIRRFRPLQANPSLLAVSGRSTTVASASAKITHYKTR